MQMRHLSTQALRPLHVEAVVVRVQVAPPQLEEVEGAVAAARHFQRLEVAAVVVQEELAAVSEVSAVSEAAEAVEGAVVGLVDVIAALQVVQPAE